MTKTILSVFSETRCRALGGQLHDMLASSHHSVIITFSL